jgi:hypothetical protein
MITLQALTDTIDYIIKKYNDISDENFLMNYRQYYELKELNINIKKLNVTPATVQQNFLQFNTYEIFGFKEEILTNEERIIKNIIE